MRQVLSFFRRFVKQNVPDPGMPEAADCARGSSLLIVVAKGRRRITLSALRSALGRFYSEGFGILARNERRPQKARMKKIQRVGHDHIRQDVIPTVPKLTKNPFGLGAISSFPGCQQGGVTLTARSGHQSEQARSKSVTQQKASQTLELPVAGKGIRLTQNHPPSEKTGQHNPQPANPGHLRLRQDKMSLDPGNYSQAGHFDRSQVRKGSGAQIAQRFVHSCSQHFLKMATLEDFVKRHRSGPGAVFLTSRR